MKAKLIKNIDDYTNDIIIYYSLIINEECIGTTHDLFNNEMTYKLSLKNCQAIERGYDLDELAENAFGDNDAGYVGFKLGFRKALEILGDRRFSEEDVRRAMQDYSLLDISEDKIIQSLQQNKWEVEIEMEEVNIGDKYTPEPKPKLDADGCLILKRVV